MKEVPAQDLESLSSCDIEICVSYFGSSDYVTDQQRAVFKKIYVTNFKVLGLSSHDTLELGKVLTKFNTEELQVAVSKLTRLTEFADLGKVNGWSSQQLKVLLNIFKSKFNLTSSFSSSSSSSNQNQFSPDLVFAMGNIFCGSSLSEIYQWVVSFDEKLKVMQFVGTLQCSQNWFQDLFQLFKTMSRDPAGIVAMGNIALGYNNLDGCLDSLSVDQIQKLTPEFLSQFNGDHVTSFFGKLSPEQISEVRKRGVEFPEEINSLMKAILLGHDSYQLSSSYHEVEENVDAEKQNDVTQSPEDSQDNHIQYEYQSQYSNVIYIFAFSSPLSLNLNILTFSFLYFYHYFL